MLTWRFAGYGADVAQHSGHVFIGEEQLKWPARVASQRMPSTAQRGAVFSVTIEPSTVVTPLSVSSSMRRESMWPVGRSRNVPWRN